MVTSYTSFVAVMEEVRNPAGDSKDVAQPQTKPFGVSGLAIGGYMVGAEPNGMLLALLLSAVLLFKYSRKKYLNGNR